MPTYTTNYSIPKPTVGADTDTWGGSLNSGMDIIDSTLAAKLSTSALGTGVATFLGTPTSANLAAAVTDETGTGALVFATSPNLTTPNIGTPSAGTLTNCTGLPASTGISGLGTGVAAFLATPSSANLAAALTDETGSGAAVFATSPTLVTPDIGTPSSGVLTNCTGLPLASVTGLGTGVQTFLTTPSSANLAAAVTDETGTGALVFATSPALTTPNIGTPSAGTLTNCTGLPLGSVTGMGTGVSTFLATPTSANLAAALTDETGSGAVVFANTPTLVTPNIGAATGTSLNVSGNVIDSKGNVRSIPQNAQGSGYTLVAADAGKHVTVTGGVTVASGVFSVGDAITIYNNSASSITVTQGASVTLRLAGSATTGSRTLAQRGVVTLLCVASNEFVCSGGGLS